MSAPSNFDHAAYQKRIDEITGTRDGRPLIKLAWAPDELRWMPHRLGQDPPGYVFPIFCHGKDAEGHFTAPERWVLLQRIEPEQYAREWEGKRYVNWRGSIWDVKGPCPSEKYVELRCHSYHNGECCFCIGDTCECGEQYDHCWGRYAEPDERLLEWIRKVAWEARQDPDVNPTEDMTTFTADHAQQELKNEILAEQEKDQTRFDDLDQEIRDYWDRKPHSASASVVSLTPEQERMGEQIMRDGRSLSKTTREYAAHLKSRQDAYDAEHPIGTIKPHSVTRTDSGIILPN